MFVLLLSLIYALLGGAGTTAAAAPPAVATSNPAFAAAPGPAAVPAAMPGQVWAPGSVAFYELPQPAGAAAGAGVEGFYQSPSYRSGPCALHRQPVR